MTKKASKAVPETEVVFGKNSNITVVNDVEEIIPRVDSIEALAYHVQNLISSVGRNDQSVVDPLREAVHQLNHAAEALAARQTSQEN